MSATASRCRSRAQRHQGLSIFCPPSAKRRADGFPTKRYPSCVRTLLSLRRSKLLADSRGARRLWGAHGTDCRRWTLNLSLVPSHALMSRLPLERCRGRQQLSAPRSPCLYPFQIRAVHQRACEGVHERRSGSSQRDLTHKLSRFSRTLDEHLKASFNTAAILANVIP